MNSESDHKKLECLCMSLLTILKILAPQTQLLNSILVSYYFEDIWQYDLEKNLYIEERDYML